MAFKNWTLKTPVTGKIIELTSGSDVLIEGSSYNFVLPTDHGVAINQIDFTYRASNGSETEFSFEEFIKVVPKLNFKVVQVVSNTIYVIEYLSNDRSLDLPEVVIPLEHYTRGKVTFLDDRGTEKTYTLPTKIDDLTSIAGTLDTRCLNYSHITTTEVGAPDVCFLNPNKLESPCTDNRAWNSVKLVDEKNSASSTVFEASCAYDQFGFESIRKLSEDLTVNPAAKSYEYISIPHQYEGGMTWAFGALLSPLITNIENVFWDISYDSAVGFVADSNYTNEGMVVVDLPAGENVIALEVVTSNNTFFTYVTVIVDAVVLGCTDINATNYNPDATTDNGSCIGTSKGCMDNGFTYLSTSTAGGFPVHTTINPLIPGLPATNFNSNANQHLANTCVYDICTDPGASNYHNAEELGLDTTQHTGCQSCCTYVGVVRGCTDPGEVVAGLNPGNIYGSFNVATTTGSTASNGSVTMNPANSNWNFNPHANEQSGRCLPKLDGCMDPLASNYITPSGNPTIDINWHIPDSCEYTVCSDSTASNYNKLDGTGANVNSPGVDDWGYTANGGSWTETDYWVAEDLGTQTALTSSDEPYNADTTLCTFTVPVDDLCANVDEFLPRIASRNVSSGDLGYMNTLLGVAPNMHQLNPATGDSCISDLTRTESVTVSGFTYNKVTEERVTTQVITQNNPVLYLTNPELNGTIVYNYTGSTGGNPPITLSNISANDAPAVASALSAANYNGSLVPTVYYYFRVVDITQDSLNGVSLAPEFSQNPIEYLFNDPNVTKVSYQQGTYFYVPGGSLANFQAGNDNTDIPIGYAVNADPVGGLAYNHSSATGCTGFTNEAMYTVYRVEVGDYCIDTALNFVIGADLSSVPEDLAINNTPVFNSSVVGCTDETATNFNSEATISGSSNYLMSNWTNYINDGGCYISGCVDEYYSASSPSNNLIVSEHLLEGTNIPLQVGLEVPEFGGVIYRIYNGHAYICPLENHLSSSFNYDSAITAAANATTGGFSDWSLPDADHLIAMYKNIHSPTSGYEDEFYFTDASYWSNTIHTDNVYSHSYNFATGPATTDATAVATELKVRLSRKVSIDSLIEGRYSNNCGDGVNAFGCTDPAASNYIASAIVSPIVGDTADDCIYDFHIDDWTEGNQNYNDQIISLGYEDIFDAEGNLISTASEDFVNSQESYSDSVGFEGFGNYLTHYSAVHAWNHPTLQGIILPAFTSCLSDKLVPFTSISAANGTPGTLTATPAVSFGYNQIGTQYTNRIQVIGKKDSSTGNVNFICYATNPEKDSIHTYTLSAGAYLASTPTTYLLGNSTSTVHSMMPHSAKGLVTQFSNLGYVTPENGGFKRSSHQYMFRFAKNLTYKVNPITGLLWNSYTMLLDLFGDSEVVIRDQGGTSYWPILNAHTLNGSNTNSSDPQSNSYHSDNPDYMHLSFGSFLSSITSDPTAGEELLGSSTFPDNNTNNVWTNAGNAADAFTFVDSGGGDYVARRASVSSNLRTGLHQSISVTPNKKYQILYKKKVDIINTDSSYSDYAKTYVELQPDGTNFGPSSTYGENQYFSDNTEQTVIDYFTYVGSLTTLDVVLYAESTWEGDITEFSIKEVAQYPDGYITQQFKNNNVACDDAKTVGYYVYQLITQGAVLDKYDFSPYLEYPDEVSGCMDETALNYDPDAVITAGNYTDCMYYLTSCAGYAPEIKVVSQDEYHSTNGVGCAQAYTVTVEACPSVLSNAQINMVLGQLQTNTTSSPITIGDFVLDPFTSAYVPILQIADIEPCIEGIQQTDSPALTANFTYDPTLDSHNFSNIAQTANIPFITGGEGVPLNADIEYHADFQLQYEEYYTNPDGSIPFTPQSLTYQFGETTQFNGHPLISPIINGCTHDLAVNYNENATCYDGSCIARIYGCTDNAAFNYNSSANTDDGSCIPVVLGCTDSAAHNTNYNINVVEDDPSVLGTAPYGNISDVSAIYGPFPNATTDNIPVNTDNDRICFYCPAINGTTGTSDQFTVEYLEESVVEDGILYTPPSTSNLEFTWTPSINTGDPSLSMATAYETSVTLKYRRLRVFITVDSPSDGPYEPGVSFYIDKTQVLDEFEIVTSLVTYDDLLDGVLVDYYKINAPAQIYVLDSLAFTAYYNAPGGESNVNRCAQTITHQVNSDLYPNLILGCLDKDAFNFYANSNFLNSTGTTNVFIKDTDGTFTEILNTAVPNVDVDSYTDRDLCIPVVEGCTDSSVLDGTPIATNYNPLANTDDGRCTYDGCTDETADNYEAWATNDNGSCVKSGCTESWAVNYDDTATRDNNSCYTYGCTDPNAYNSHWCLDDSNPCFGASSDYTASAITSTSCYYEGCMDSGEGVNQSAINLITEFASENTGNTTLNDVLENVPVGVTHNMNNEIAAVQSLPVNPGEAATNYQANATISGPCIYEGCTDPNASNYDADAIQDATPSLCVYEACIDETATNFGEGITVTGNVSNQANAQNSCFGPDLLAPANKTNAEYWGSTTYTSIVDASSNVKVETNGSYTGEVAARVVLSPFNPQPSAAGEVVSKYSILEYDSTASQNSVGVLTSLEYPLVSASDILLYNYYFEVLITSDTPVTATIKEFNNVTWDSTTQTINTTPWSSGFDALSYTELSATVLANQGDKYFATKWKPHYEAQLIILEISGAAASSNFIIDDIVLKRETCQDVVLSQESFSSYAGSESGITLGLDNAELYSVVGNTNNIDGDFHIIRTHIDQGDYGQYANGDLWPTRKGSNYFANPLTETWRRTYHLGDGPRIGVWITPYYEARFRASWPAWTYNLNYTHITAEPRAVLSQLSNYGEGNIYRLDFKAKIGSNWDTDRNRQVGISDYVGSTYDEADAAVGIHYLTEVNPNYSTTGVYNTIPNNTNRFILEEDWVDYTVYWVASTHSNGIAFYNFNTGDPYEFLVKDISVVRVDPQVFHTSSDTCYLFGCGDSGLYPAGHANEGDAWAENYNEDVSSEIGIDLPVGAVGPNGEESCKLGGCMIPGMDNYNEFATYDDGSCYKYGCTDSGLINAPYSPYPGTFTLETWLATSELNTVENYIGGYPADNYDVLATINEVSATDASNPCTYTGCMDPGTSPDYHINYSELYTTQDNSTCIDAIGGCSKTPFQNYNPNSNTNDTASCCIQLAGTDSDGDGIFELQENTYGYAPSNYAYSGVSSTAKPILFELYSANCAGAATTGVRFKSGYSTFPDQLLNADGTPKISNITVNAYRQSNGAIDINDTTFPTRTFTYNELVAGVTDISIYSSVPTVLAVFIVIKFNYSNVVQSGDDGNTGTSCEYKLDLHLDDTCATHQGCTDDGWNTAAIDGFNALTGGFPQQGFNPNVNQHVANDCTGAHVLGCMDTNYAIPANQHVGVGASTTQTSHPTFNKTTAPSGNDVRGEAYDGWSTSATINMYDDTYANNSAGTLYGTSLGAYHPIYTDLTLSDGTDPSSSQYGATPSPNTFEGSVYGCFPKVFGCKTAGKFNFNNWYHAGNINPTTGVAYAAADFPLLNFGIQYNQDVDVNPSTGVVYTNEELLQNVPYLYNVNTNGTSTSSAADSCFDVVPGCTNSSAANFISNNLGGEATTALALANQPSTWGVAVNQENQSCCFDETDLPANATYPISLTSNCASLYNTSDGGLPTVYETNIYDTIDFTSGWKDYTTGVATALTNSTTLTHTADANIYILDALANLDANKQYRISLTATASYNSSLAVYFVNESTVAAITDVPSLQTYNDSPKLYLSAAGYNANQEKTIVFFTEGVRTGFKDLAFEFFSNAGSTFTISNIDIQEWKHPSFGVNAQIDVSNWPALVENGVASGVINYNQIQTITAVTKNASNTQIYNSGSKTLADFETGVNLYTYIYNDAAAGAGTSGTYDHTYHPEGINGSGFVDPNLATKVVFTITHKSANDSACTGNDVTLELSLASVTCTVRYGCTDSGFLEYYLKTTAETNSNIDGSSIDHYSTLVHSFLGNQATIDNGSCHTSRAPGCTDPGYLESYPNKERAYTPNWSEGDVEFTEYTATLLRTPDNKKVYGYLGSLGSTIGTFPNTIINLSDPDTCDTPIVFGCVLDHFADYWGATSTPTNSNTIYGIDENQGSFISETGVVSSWANVSLENNQSNGVPVDHALLLGCGDATVNIGCTQPSQIVEYTYPGNTVPTSVTTSWCNYDPLHNVKAAAGSNDCAGKIGCVDPNYVEFDGLANSISPTVTNEGVTFGCDHNSFYLDNHISNFEGDLALNSDFPGTTVSNSINPCGIIAVPGCTDSSYVEYNPDANAHVQSMCETVVINGCTDESYCEYYFGAVVINGATLYPTVDDGSCVSPIGCTNPNFTEAYNTNYDGINFELLNGSTYGIPTNGCNTFTQQGTSLSSYLQENPSNTSEQFENEGCRTPIIVGCTDSSKDTNGNNIYLNYNPLANLSCSNNGEYNTCCQEAIYGCTDGTVDASDNLLYYNFNPNATADDGSCIASVIGCTQSGTFGYNPLANLDDGSCLPILEGCIESTFTYNGVEVSSANYEEPYIPGNPNTVSYPNTHTAELCFPVIEGCTNPLALNYNNYGEDELVGLPLDTSANANFINVNTDNDSCILSVTGCMDECATNYDETATVSALCTYTPGCTDNSAYNYEPNTNQNNGTCLYCDDWSATSVTSPYVQFTNNTSSLNGVSSEDGAITISPVTTTGETPNYEIRWFRIQDNTYTPLEQFTNQIALTGLAPGSYHYILYSTSSEHCAPDFSLGYPIQIGSQTVRHSGVNCSFDDGDIETYSTSPGFVSQQGNVIIITTDGYGCTDNTGISYSHPTLGDPIFTAEGGATNSYTAGVNTTTTLLAGNYDPFANIDDGTCVYPGCTDTNALNYSADATLENGTCIYIQGCQDPIACNYNPSATVYGECTYSAAYRDCDNVCLAPENISASNPFGESLSFPGLCPEQVLSDCIDTEAINFQPLVNSVRAIPRGSAQRMRIVKAPIAIEDDGSCIYENPCVPTDIYDILDALADTINAQGKTVLTNLRTGMLDPADTATLWTLMLIDYVMNKVGFEGFYNCAGYNYEGKVTYTEGVDSINYFDKFLTFAFKNGDEQFTGIESNRAKQALQSPVKMKRKATLELLDEVGKGDDFYCNCHVVCIDGREWDVNYRCSVAQNCDDCCVSANINSCADRVDFGPDGEAIPIKEPIKEKLPLGKNPKGKDPITSKYKTDGKPVKKFRNKNY